MQPRVRANRYPLPVKPSASSHDVRRARLIALYLPQFHPIPENDAWWGPGFTEWTNTRKARPLFVGHYQPHVPAELGYYDLRDSAVREAQAALAQQHGIEAFCYYHYWFAGRRLLERPFNEVLASGKPDFPFCLCWANETWSGVWHGAPDRVLIEQTYPGGDDHAAHFAALLPAFRDPRYVRVDGKPFFAIYRPMHVPRVAAALRQWRDLARKAGLPGLHFVGVETDQYPDWRPADHGFDASFRANVPQRWIPWRRPVAKIARQTRKWIQRGVGSRTPAWVAPIYRYRDVCLPFVAGPFDGQRRYPSVLPNWDNTPRSGIDGVVVHESTPALFRLQLRKALDLVGDLPREERIVVVKAWNEWAEGNHLEPDRRDGRAYLDVVREEVCESAAALRVLDAHDRPTTPAAPAARHAASSMLRTLRQ